MGPRKSSSQDNYASALTKLCVEEDVLIVPEFFTLHLDRSRSFESHSPMKSRESKFPGKRENSTLMSASDLGDECDALRPPRVGIAYENPEEKENPLVVVCKNIFIEFSLIRAIEKSLALFPTLDTLRIEDCCIGKELAEGLALVLAGQFGRRISDLSLDGNNNIGRFLPLFLSFPTGLKYFSVQRCGLDDEDVMLLSEALAAGSDEKEKKLLVLNLGMNKIGNVGVSHLANALRTNRTLISLSLIGNQIGDEGAIQLAKIFKKFELTHEEIVFRRRRIFERIAKENLTAGAGKSMGEVERTNPRIASKSVDRVAAGTRKIRGPDGKFCLASRDKKGKVGPTKLNSGEKFGSKGEEGRRSFEAKSSMHLGSGMKSECEIPPDEHPFVGESSPADGKMWCIGCWSISSVNLAYNYLTERSVDEFLEAVEDQNENLKPSLTGLTRIVLTPGNSIDEDSSKMKDLKNRLLRRRSRKEISEMSFPVSKSSRSPSRIMSTSARRKSSLIGKKLE